MTTERRALYRYHPDDIALEHAFVLESMKHPQPEPKRTSRLRRPAKAPQPKAVRSSHRRTLTLYAILFVAMAAALFLVDAFVKSMAVKP